MKPVFEFSTIRSGLFSWQGYESTVKCDCSSSAIVTPSGLIFIDPIPLEEEALREMVAESFSTPSAVIITNGNHQRDSLRFARRFGIPVFAPQDSGDDIIADSRFVPGESVAGMDTLPLPGFAPGESVLLYDGILIFGDALLNLEPEGLRLLPEKYRGDTGLSLRSLPELKNLGPKIILFAHGTPILQNASEKLGACLARETLG